MTVTHSAMCVATAKAKGQPLGDRGRRPCSSLSGQEGQPRPLSGPPVPGSLARYSGTQFPKEGGFPEASLKRVLH